MRSTRVRWPHERVADLVDLEDATGRHEHEAEAKHIPAEDLEMTPQEYRRLRWKIDLRTIPYFSLLYLLSFLDVRRLAHWGLTSQRANIGQARTAGLEADLGLVGNQYQVALTVFFVTCASRILVCAESTDVFFEIPAVALIRKIGPARLIAATMILWSIVMTLMGVTSNFGTLVTARFFLGLFEAPLFPALNCAWP